MTVSVSKLDLDARECVLEFETDEQFEAIESGVHNALHMHAKAVKVTRDGNTAVVEWWPSDRERSTATPSEIIGMVVESANAGETKADMDARVLAVFTEKRTDKNVKVEDTK